MDFNCFLPCPLRRKGKTNVSFTHAKRLRLTNSARRRHAKKIENLFKFEPNKQTIFAKCVHIAVASGFVEKEVRWRACVENQPVCMLPNTKKLSLPNKVPHLMCRRRSLLVHSAAAREFIEEFFFCASRPEERNCRRSHVSVLFSGSSLLSSSSIDIAFIQWNEMRENKSHKN